MKLSSERNNLNSGINYLVDALRFSLSVSPNSIPCNDTIGLEIPATNIKDEIWNRVSSILKVIDPSGEMKYEGCDISKGKISIKIRFSNTDSVFRFII